MHDPQRPQRGRYRLHPPVVDDVTRRRVGEANIRGRLERDLGPFFLRPGLTAPGAISFADALAEVTADWDRQVAAGTIGDGVVRQYERRLNALSRVMTTHGLVRVSDLNMKFLLMWCLLPKADGNPVTENTRNFRRSAARSFFDTARCLGMTDANPANDIEFPSRSNRFVNALTDNDIDQLKRSARTDIDDTRTPAALAVVMSGATTRELSAVTIADVDLVNTRVWVHGGGYRQRDRWVTLRDDWCVTAVTRRVTELHAIYGADADGVWLVYKPHSSQPNPTRQDTAAGMLILRLMKFAGVHRPGVTRAESIREWYAETVFAQTGSVEEVARRLGMASLDAVAHIVGHDWVTDHGSVLDQDPPPHRREVAS